MSVRGQREVRVRTQSERRGYRMYHRLHVCQHILGSVLGFANGAKSSCIFGGLHNTAAMLNWGSPGWRALGQAVLVYLAIASSAATAQDSQPGRATFAEMVAFARLGSVACQRLAPDVEGFHALALLRLIKPPLTDKAIVAKEKEVKRLRDRLGLSRWCRLYAGEMEQARSRWSPH